jgi:hypothetical protein
MFDELWSVQIWQHKLCGTLSAKRKYKLPSLPSKYTTIVLLDISETK